MQAHTRRKAKQCGESQKMIETLDRCLILLLGLWALVIFSCAPRTGMASKIPDRLLRAAAADSSNPFAAFLANITSLASSLPTSNSVVDAPGYTPPPLADLRLYWDYDHAPFLAGVASADPLEDAVLIWTHVIDNRNAVSQIEWRVWEKANISQSFNRPLYKGNASVVAENNFTVTIDVTGLKAGTSYHYQFQHVPTRRKSVLGTTKTIPTNTDSVTVATLSCTSLWSGYFNFYRHLASNDDVDVVLHIGDYIYPEIDLQEMYRVPEGFCGKVIPRYRGTPLDSSGTQAQQQPWPHSFDPDEDVTAQVDFLCDLPILDIFRQLHMFYHQDPDFRAAKARHPFIVQYDNHDLFGHSYDPLEGSRKAMLEWVPQRVQYEGPRRVTNLRRFRYGKNGLLDIVVLDEWAFKVNQSENNLLGRTQFNWLSDQLAAQPTAQWRLFGSEKTFMPFTLNVVVPWKRELVFFNPTPDTWDGNQPSLIEFFNRLEIAGTVKNNVWTVGDAHYCYMADVFRYDPDTLDLLRYRPWENRVQRYGVEFMPCSGSRGNFDETLGGITPLLRPGTVASEALKPVLTALIRTGNKHYRWFDPNSHGYGTLTFSPSKVVGTIYFFPILNVTDEFTTITMVSKDGDNKWTKA